MLGRRRQAVTEHHYDDDGRLVRSVTTFDERWTDDDLEWALDWHRDRRLRCGGCGFRLDETTDPDRHFNEWDAKTVECKACAQGERERNRQIETSSDNRMPPGGRIQIWER